MHPCHYGTERGSYAADCGTLVVPENRAKPGSRLIGVKVIRIKARSAHPGAPIFRLQGGPGGTNMTFKLASRLADRHDVVLVGYRGIDSSVRLDCPEVSSALKRSTDFLGAEVVPCLHARLPRLRRSAPGGRRRSRGLHAAAAGRRSRGRPPGARLQADRPGQRERRHAARDDLRLALPAQHQPLGDDRRQPARALPLEPEATDELIGRYSRLCARDASCSNRTDDLAASMRKTAADIPAASGACRSRGTTRGSRPSTR